MKTILVFAMGLLSLAGIFSILRNQNIDPVIDATDKSLKLSIYSRGKPGREVIVTTATPLVEKINKIIVQKRGKWKRSLVSFAPVIILRGEKTTINCQENRIIVNFQNSEGKGIQVVTDLTSEEYSEIRHAAEKLTNEASNNGKPSIASEKG